VKVFDIFKLKSAFDPCQRFIWSLCFGSCQLCCQVLTFTVLLLWLNDTSYSKSVWRSE